MVAISPILLYIGMLIGAQAFQETPKSHAPAIVLALTPHLAAWGKLQIDNALGAAGTNAHARRPRQAGPGRRAVPRASRCWAAARSSAAWCSARSRAFVIDREFIKAAAFALAGAVLTFFGFMHGEAIGIGADPGRRAQLPGVAGFLFAFAKFAVVAPKPAEQMEEHHGAVPEPAE